MFIETLANPVYSSPISAGKITGGGLFTDLTGAMHPMSVFATRYRLTARTFAALSLPPYAGSMLRGAFGHALRAVSQCPTEGVLACTRCQQSRNCAYAALFEPPVQSHKLQAFSAIPVPYVIEPPLLGAQRLAKGQRFQFHMVLFGSAHQHRRAITQAWMLALRHGLGIAHAQVELEDMAEEDAPAALPVAPVHTESVELEFETPLRLQDNSRPLGVEELTPEKLIIGLARRTQLIATFHCNLEANWDFQAIKAAALQLTSIKRMHWFDWGRYSTRQQREMKFGGAIGNWRLEGPSEALTSLAPILHLGQWLHIGKNTAFGLGKYKLKNT